VVSTGGRFAFVARFPWLRFDLSSSIAERGDSTGLRSWTMEVVIGAVLSVLTAFGLWAVLPRGVVLTRSVRGYQGIQSMWELRNDSALAVRIRSVKVMGPITYNEETGKIDEIELPPEYLPGDKYFGAFKLAFIDPVTEIMRADQLQPWSKQVVLPGDSLRADVVSNVRMQVKYRRTGPFGIFERREIAIQAPP
jgi:hypothetical protein